MDRIGGKIGFYNTEVFGWRKAIHGMKAPMQSYHLTDEKVANETWLNIKDNIEKLEEYRQQYKGLQPSSYTKNQLLTIAKRILPECFIQIRFWDLNYQTAYNMYNQRVVCPHRLKEEWVDCFGTWCKRLPKFKELFLDETISEVV